MVRSSSNGPTPVRAKMGQQMHETPAEPPAPSDVERSPSRDVAPVGGVAPGSRSLAEEFLAALRFYSRLPIPVLAFETQPQAALDLERGAVGVALAGAVIGAVGGVVLLAAVLLSLPAFLSAVLAVAALVVVTGAMHEDGLADTADGFWGGQTAERRLAIMRDSRIGTYGVVALILGIGMRVAAVAGLIVATGAWTAALVLVAVGAVSRVAGLVPLWLLAPARSDGLAASVGRPTTTAMAGGLGVASLVSLLPILGTGVPAVGLVIAVGTAFAAAWAMARISAAKIGGQTGDVAGAAQQFAEMAMLVALVAAA